MQSPGNDNVRSEGGVTAPSGTNGEISNWEICLIEGTKSQSEEAPSSVQQLLLNYHSGKFLDVISSIPQLADCSQFTDLKSQEDFRKFIWGELRTLWPAESCTCDNTALFIGAACLQIFIQANWTGPPLPPDTPETPSFLKCVEALNQPGCAKTLADQCLFVDGEFPYSKTLFPFYLVVAKSILIDSADMLSTLKTSEWWAARALFAHQRILSERSASLKEAIRLNMSKAVGRFATDTPRSDLAALVHLEYAAIHHWYCDSNLAAESLESATSASGLSVALTGARGKRTKFQTFETTQLVVEASSSAQGPQVANGASVGVREVSHEDADLLPRPVFSSTSEAASSQLAVVDQCILLLMCAEVRSRGAQSAETREEMGAFVARVEKHPQNWLVHSTCLLLRSRLEADSNRLKERGVLQLQVLVDQYVDAAPGAAERLQYAHMLPFPSRWDLKRELGERFLGLGAAASALQLFEALELWENVVQCLQIMNKNAKAEEVVRARLEVEPANPLLWCLLGDLTSNAGWYDRAWEVSNHRFARAQRSLARFCFEKGQYAESIAHYRLALAINPLFKGSWFTAGCAAMRIEDWDFALQAFTRVVQIDPEDAESWNNIASVYIRLRKKNEAYLALQEGLKHRYENWKMWQNLLYVAVDLGRYQHAVHAIMQLLDLQPESKDVDVEIVSILVKAVSAEVAFSSDSDPAPLGTGTSLKKQVGEMLARITSRVTNNPDVWRIFAQYHRILGNAEKVIEMEQKRSRTLQTGEWNRQKEPFERAVQGAVDLVEAYMGTPTAKNLYSARLFLKGILKKSEDSFSDSDSATLLRDLLRRVEALEATSAASS